MADFIWLKLTLIPKKNEKIAFRATFSGLRGNVRTPSIARWKACGRLCIRYNWTLFRYLLRLRRYKWKLVEVGVLLRGGGLATFGEYLTGKGHRPPTNVGVRKLGWLPFRMIKISALHHLGPYFCHNTRIWQTDRRTERRTELRQQYRDATFPEDGRYTAIVSSWWSRDCFEGLVDLLAIKAQSIHSTDWRKVYFLMQTLTDIDFSTVLNLACGSRYTDDKMFLLQTLSSRHLTRVPPSLHWLQSLLKRSTPFHQRNSHEWTRACVNFNRN